MAHAVNTVAAKSSPLPAGLQTQVQHGPPTTPLPAIGVVDLGTRIGDYEITKKIGSGGMGAVFLARDQSLDRDVAIKVLLPEYSTNPEARERFHREARAAAGITHDNVLSVYQVGTHEGRLFLVMPLLRGYSLETYLQKKGLPAIRQSIRIARELVQGLSAAHARGLIHRDIKPGNIWLETPSGRVKILDFGIAKPSTKEDSLTKSGVLVGTPAYMSPEQARGHKVDGRSDLFSVGALLYRLCTGSSPFVKETVMETLTALVAEEPIPPHERNATVPPSLSRFILRLLAKNPAHRFASCQETLEELRAIEREMADEKPGATAERTANLNISSVFPVASIEADPGFEILDDTAETATVKQSPKTVRNRKTATRRMKKKRGFEPQQLAVGITVAIIGVIVLGVGIGWLLSKNVARPKATPNAVEQAKVPTNTQTITVPEVPVQQEP